MPQPETKRKWDEETDVIVIGSGFAGLAAAIEAARAGCSVLVLEKMKGFGGNSTISDGCMAAAGTNMQAAEGVEDSPGLMAADMLKAGLGLNQPDLVRVVTEGSAEAFEWTRSFLGVQYQGFVERFGGHSVARSHTTLHRTGADIIKQLLIKTRASGATIRTRAHLQTLVRNSAGRVNGVVVRQRYLYPDSASGKAVCIKARKAVILAAGGFGNDVAFRSAQDPRLDEGIDSTNKYSARGGALREAMRIGAMPVHLSWIQLGPWACPDEKGYGVGPGFSSYIAFPYGIIVDPETGGRVANELADRKIRADAILAKGHPCVCLTDQQGIDASGHGIDRALKKGVVKTFDRLRDLAAEFSLSSDVLEDTVGRFNRFVAEGKDRDFDKPILPAAGQLTTPPFYAMRLWPKVHYTMGGILIDVKARVLDLNRRPIAGFLAAGEVTGGIHGACRLGSCAIADCLVFGRIAGREAVQ